MPEKEPLTIKYGPRISAIKGNMTELGELLSLAATGAKYEAAGWPNGTEERAIYNRLEDRYQRMVNDFMHLDVQYIQDKGL